LKINRKYAGLLTGLLMSITMSTVMALIMTSVNIGFNEQFLIKFLDGLSFSLCISIPTGLLVSPRIRRLVEVVTE